MNLTIDASHFVSIPMKKLITIDISRFYSHLPWFLPQFPFIISKSFSRPADPSLLEHYGSPRVPKPPPNPSSRSSWSPRNREGLRRGCESPAGGRSRIAEDHGTAVDREGTDGDRDPWWTKRWGIADAHLALVGGGLDRRERVAARSRAFGGILNIRKLGDRNPMAVTQDLKRAECQAQRL